MSTSLHIGNTVSNHFPTMFSQPRHIVSLRLSLVVDLTPGAVPILDPGGASSSRGCPGPDAQRPGPRGEGPGLALAQWLTSCPSACCCHGGSSDQLHQPTPWAWGDPSLPGDRRTPSSECLLIGGSLSPPRTSHYTESATSVQLFLGFLQRVPPPLGAPPGRPGRCRHAGLSQSSTPGEAPRGRIGRPLR